MSVDVCYYNFQLYISDDELANYIHIYPIISGNKIIIDLLFTLSVPSICVSFQIVR